ncbi:MAG: metalloregulator ArsR/SmtB family transcription factor [Gammaproteobacteria bacterium]
MAEEISFSTVASLIADPTRSAILVGLLDGRALPAGELAYASGVTAQTASAHLSKLLAGGLLSVEIEGRHRYYRLAGPHIAEALERLAAISPMEPVRRRPLSPKAKELRFARCCYNHLAGRLGVAVAGSLQEKRYIIPAPDKLFELTPQGVVWFAKIGLDVQRVRPTRRGLARQCLDWTERMHHLAGPLGVELLNVFCSQGWLRRSKDSRAVRVTPTGHTALKKHLGIDARDLRDV